MSTLLEAPKATTRDVVAANVRAEAARRGFSQMDLARALGASQGSVNKKWRGLRSWQLEELDALAMVLELSVADLITPTGREKLAPPTGLEPATSGLVSSTWWTVAA